MVVSREIRLVDGRTLRVHDSGAGVGASAGADTHDHDHDHTLLWHHGSPQTGAPLSPVLAAATARGICLLSYARPSYGGSTEQLGRTVADAASDVERLLDALDIERCSVMGASGGGPHALACAAVLGDRITAAVTLAGIAPFPASAAASTSASASTSTSTSASSADAADWFAGMADEAGLRAALQGRDHRALYEESAEFEPASFVDRDYAALDGEWKCLGTDVAEAQKYGMGGLVDDDCAFVAPWGIDLGSIRVPVLVVQGGRDRVVPRAHADRLMRSIPTAELWLRPLDGHVSVLNAVPVAMDWIRAAG